MLMAPSCRGDTRIPAVEERIRYRPSSVAGSGAGLNMSDISKVFDVNVKARVVSKVKFSKRVGRREEKIGRVRRNGSEHVFSEQ